MAPTIETLLSGLGLGEGPHWDATNQCLYFVEVQSGYINKYVPSTKKHTKAFVGDQSVSVIIPIKGKKNKFLTTQDDKLVTVTWDGESSKTSDLKVLLVLDKTLDASFNDGKADGSGRLWIGSYGRSPTGAVDQIPLDKGDMFAWKEGKLQSQKSGLGISNGLAFNNKLKKMYHNDSFRSTVFQYDFNIENGTINNTKPIFTKEKHGLEKGLFDGMTIDSDGNLWIAIVGTGKVVKINPEKPETLLETIEFPAKAITSLAFGGKNLDELYVTSANIKEFGGTEGHLFKVTGLGVRGLPGDEVVF